MGVGGGQRYAVTLCPVLPRHPESEGATRCSTHGEICPARFFARLRAAIGLPKLSLKKGFVA